MMEQQTWTVVQFIDDGTVKAVPSTWIEGDLCHWPSLAQNQLANAIKKCKPLNKCWPTHKIIVFRNATFDDYTKARTKARVAEDTSDVQSETEMSNKPKRIKKNLWSTDESLNEFSLLTPPKMKEMTTLDNSISMDIIDEEIINNDIKREIEGDENFLKENILIENVNAGPTCSGCKEKDIYLETIITQNRLIRALVADTLQEVKNLRQELQSGRGRRENYRSLSLKYPHLQFPLNSLKDLEQLEEILKNKEDFVDGVNELTNFGGSNNYNFVKRTLSSLITNDLALLFSWLGRKGKKDFHNLTLARLIIYAAEKANISKSKKETETSIQTWLKRASDRKTSHPQKI